MSTLVGFVKLIRWGNLLMLSIAQFIFYYIVFPISNTVNETSLLHFILLTLATVFIAASGYIINDVFDTICDKINKPNKTYIPNPISEKMAFRYYFLFSALGILLGTFLSYILQNLALSFVFIGIAISLYLYSKYIQKTPLLGNILISILVASNTLIIPLFTISPSYNTLGFDLLIQFSFFAFFINLLREIIKDIQDIDGDFNAKMKTLPITIGIERTKKVIYSISIIPLYFMIRFCIDDLKYWVFTQVYCSVFILLPLLIFYIKLKQAKNTKNFKFLSKLLKGILVFGLLLLLIIIL
jgi:4-hydroxybenzoate polyprenyltransferase